MQIYFRFGIVDFGHYNAHLRLGGPFFGKMMTRHHACNNCSHGYIFSLNLVFGGHHRKINYDMAFRKNRYRQQDITEIFLKWITSGWHPKNMSDRILLVPQKFVLFPSQPFTLNIDNWRDISWREYIKWAQSDAAPYYGMAEYRFDFPLQHSFYIQLVISYTIQKVVRGVTTTVCSKVFPP